MLEDCGAHFQDNFQNKDFGQRPKLSPAQTFSTPPRVRDIPAAFSGHPRFPSLVGRRFAHQRFPDSRGSIRATNTYFLSTWPDSRESRLLSDIEIRAIRVQSSLLSHFLEGRFAKKAFFEARNDSRESAH